MAFLLDDVLEPLGNGRGVGQGKGQGFGEVEDFLNDELFR